MALKQNAKKEYTPKQTFPEQPPMEAGTYPARLVQIIDCGLQPQREYRNEVKKPANEVMFTYEFVDVFMVDEKGEEVLDKPRWFSETLPWYGPEAERANSAKRYKAFDPENEFDGDLSQCIGIPVNVTITINKKGDKTYVNIAGVTAMRKRDADKTPELVNPPKVFDLDDPDMEVFEKLPKWLQEKLKGNLRYEGSVLQKALGETVGSAKKDEKEADKPEDKPEAGKPQVDAEDEEEEDTPW